MDEKELPSKETDEEYGERAFKAHHRGNLIYFAAKVDEMLKTYNDPELVKMKLTKDQINEMYKSNDSDKLGVICGKYTSAVFRLQRKFVIKNPWDED